MAVSTDFRIYEERWEDDGYIQYGAGIVLSPARQDINTDYREGKPQAVLLNPGSYAMVEMPSFPTTAFTFTAFVKIEPFTRAAVGYCTVLLDILIFYVDISVSKHLQLHN